MKWKETERSKFKRKRYRSIAFSDYGAYYCHNIETERRILELLSDYIIDFTETTEIIEIIRLFLILQFFSGLAGFRPIFRNNHH